MIKMISFKVAIEIPTDLLYSARSTVEGMFTCQYGPNNKPNPSNLICKKNSHLSSSFFSLSGCPIAAMGKMKNSSQKQGNSHFLVNYFEKASWLQSISRYLVDILNNVVT